MQQFTSERRKERGVREDIAVPRPWRASCHEMEHPSDELEGHSCALECHSGALECHSDDLECHSDDLEHHSGALECYSGALECYSGALECYRCLETRGHTSEYNFAMGKEYVRCSKCGGAWLAPSRCTGCGKTYLISNDLENLESSRICVRCLESRRASKLLVQRCHDEIREEFARYYPKLRLAVLSEDCFEHVFRYCTTHLTPNAWLRVFLSVARGEVARGEECDMLPTNRFWLTSSQAARMANFVSERIRWDNRSRFYSTFLCAVANIHDFSMWPEAGPCRHIVALYNHWDTKEQMFELWANRLKYNRAADTPEEWFFVPECPVCHDPIRSFDAYEVQHCGHIFHTSCILTWLTEHDTCPHCHGPHVGRLHP